MKELVKSDLENVAGGFYWGKPDFVVARQKMVQARKSDLMAMKAGKKAAKIKFVQARRQFFQSFHQY